MPYTPSPSTAPRAPNPMRRRLALIVLIALLALAACKDKSPVIVTRFTAFGTQVDVSLVGVGKEQAKQAAARIEQDFVYLERDWHAWTPGPMTRVNRLLATGQPFVAPPSMLPLVRLSKTLETRSDGLFNPAIGRLKDLWGFHDDRLGSHPPPSPERIARLVKANPTMAQIDIDGLELRGHNSALSLDFNAIAKSHAIDLSIEHLMETGIANALIQAGGHLRAIGDRAGQPWRIPIRRPNGSGVFAILPIRGNESVATIAEYDRNFLFEGTLYHDVIDPRAGSPAQETRAVTVIHDDATTAAAAATALLIAGPTDWHRIAVKMGVRYVLLMDRQGRVRMNPAMAERIERVDDQDDIVLSEPLKTTAEPSKTELQ
ncbi:FAD:protein FMN transferase [Thiocystis violascens]|uniref:FAD:protein FMN transferase n=1 Tax=Thiocystis violascens (strain ATCC 17096 / DSM 198 / 6111) TaxID=765911 RepID=I3YDW4_THIV6|nr:FAD:protein FMN transferase [Thiocystis violascens]AFL75182.1 membrane-associated lipoprotein involved in thiamine biosynthesis [Thiocystis violascens DSM 198]